MRPRDFSAFSPVETSGKRPRVHATEARARTRDRIGRRKESEDEREWGEEVAEDREAQKWKRTVAEAGHAFRAARLPGVAEIIDEPRLNRACYQRAKEGRRGGAKAGGRGLNNVFQPLKSP